MEIRQIEIHEQDRVAERHPELTAQYPGLSKPNKVHDFARGASDFPYLFYAMAEGRVVAHFMSFLDILKSGDKEYPWAWNYGLYTDPSFRGRGIAQNLVQHQLNEFARRNLIWGGVFSSDAALRLYRRMSFHMMDRVPRLCLFRNVRPLLHRNTHSKVATMVGGLAFDAIFAMARGILFAVSQFERKYEVEMISPAAFATILANHLVRA